MFSQFAAVFGHVPQYTVADWDCDTAQVWQAILEVAATGSCIFIRPGTGRQSLGIAVWEGDIRNPAVWLYEEQQVNDWAAAILAITGKTKEKPTYPKRDGA
jgi:hypothetical protein